MKKVYSEMKDVPWYRRSALVGILALWGVFATYFVSFVFVLPLYFLIGLVSYIGLIIACVATLTGDVYTGKKDASGNIAVWGTAQKVVAVILLWSGTHLLYWFVIRRFPAFDVEVMLEGVFGAMVLCGFLMRKHDAKK